MPDLNPNQFNQPVEESEELHSQTTKKLKSPWIPTIPARNEKWNSLRNYSPLEWHLDNHHSKLQTTDPTGHVWVATSLPKGDMTPEQYHNHLHEIGHFRFGQDHQHFTPKSKGAGGKTTGGA